MFEIPVSLSLPVKQEATTHFGNDAILAVLRIGAANALLSIDYDAAASSSPSSSSEWKGGAKTIRSAPSAIFCIMLSRPWAYQWIDTTREGQCLFQIKIEFVSDQQACKLQLCCGRSLVFKVW